MATRKLKFKPKPTVGAALRRPRDKDAVPELPSEEPVISIKETVRDTTTLDNTADKTDNSIEKKPDVYQSKSLVPDKKDDSSNNNCYPLNQLKTGDNNVSKSSTVNSVITSSKELITETCLGRTSSSSKELSGIKNTQNEINVSKITNQKQEKILELEEKLSKGIDCNLVKSNDITEIKKCLDSSIGVVDTNNSNSAKQNERIGDSIVTEIKSKNTNLAKSNTITKNEKYANSVIEDIDNNVEVENVVSGIKPNDVNSTVAVSSNSCSEDTASINSNKKPNIVKGPSRFGRSRCKPVLNNIATRKKNDATSESVSVPDASIVRTDSVIKSVKEELAREQAKAIVCEIADSFSSLEAEEPNLSYNKESSYESQLRNRLINGPENDKHKDCEPPKKSSEEFFSISIDESNPLLIKSGFTNMTSHGDNSKRFIIAKLPRNNDSSSKESEANKTVKIPVSPQKSTTKTLFPKPSPRISDVNPRRISFQGNDLEDDGKKERLIDNHISKVLPKQKKQKSIKNSTRKRSQGSTYSKMGQDTLEKFSKKFKKDEEPDKAKLTMIDLIFYNPKSNPMSVSSQPAIKKKEEKLESNEMIEETLEEQSVDDVEPAAIPVPQLKIGPDGQIMLDPQSLVIETTGTEKNRAKLENSEVIQETGGLTRYRTYSKRKMRRNDWTTHETLQFYKALNTIGSDFTLMTKLFPRRSRHELKLKFKREEKANLNLVDKAMTSPADFNFKSLEEELKRENEDIANIILAKQMAKDIEKEARAQRKEEKLQGKKKPKKSMPIRKTHAYRDFNESELVNNTKEKRTKRRGRKRKTEPDLIDSDLEMDLQIDLDMESNSSENEEVDILKMVKETTSGRLPRRTSKLEEYEEMNETLKHKMCHESESEDELYTPNGPGAQMLYGTPHENPTQDPEERQWNIEIPTLPTIEETVLLGNVENVSELSELGSFGQNDTALDLSLPIRANIQRDLLRGNQSSSLLNGQLISESIQIIDQLTADVGADSMVYEDGPSNGDATEEQVLPEDEPMEDKVPLPSFGSVSSRPPMIYPLQSPFIPECDRVHQMEESGNGPDIVLSNYYNEGDQCILGD